MDYFEKIVEAIELHSVEEIKDCFENGISPNDLFRGEPLLYELTSEYARSPRFAACVKAFVDHGLMFTDEALLSVLLDDAAGLSRLINQDKNILERKYNMRCAYTAMHEVNLLHICAEFNHVACADVLVKNGVDVNIAAGADENGFGEQTPVFHTVNQNSNQSIDMLHYLLSKGVDLSFHVKGMIWGRGYPWETFIPSVNPISYAMMRRLPQMHRDESTIAEVVQLLMKHAYGIDYTVPNIPNKYLR